MKIVIDIDSYVLEHCKRHVKEHYANNIEEAIAKGTILSKGNKCKWIHYDYRTVCPRKHDVDNPYWRIPEHRMDTLKYCPYCGKEIEIKADKE